MEDIEVGEKIRCNDGLVGELIRIERDDIDTSLKWYVFDDGKNERYVNKPYITKHSFNLVDLIEVGDYVNGYRILNMTDISNSDKTVFTIYKSDFKDICRIWGEEDIETILTHEQFEANCYKVKE